MDDMMNSLDRFLFLPMQFWTSSNAKCLFVMEYFKTKLVEMKNFKKLSEAFMPDKNLRKSRRITRLIHGKIQIKSLFWD